MVWLTLFDLSLHRDEQKGMYKRVARKSAHCVGLAEADSYRAHSSDQAMELYDDERIQHTGLRLESQTTAALVGTILTWADMR